MAAVTTTGTGNWSTGSSVFSGGSGPGGVPSNADTVTIGNGHTITIDNTAAVCSTLTVASGGKILWLVSANTTLTVESTVTINSGGTWEMGSPAAPIQSAYTATLILNNALGGTGGSTYFVGNSGFASISFNGHEGRKCWTTLSAAMAAGATTCSVADSTGWVTGDDLIFTPSSGSDNSAQDAIDSKALTGVGPLAFSATTYAHASGSGVGNLTRNCIVKCASGTKRGKTQFVLKTDAVDTLSIRYTRFDNLGNASNVCAVEFNPDNTTTSANYQKRKLKSFYGNVLTCLNSGVGSWVGVGGFAGGSAAYTTLTLDNNIFYHSVTAEGVAVSGLQAATVSNSLFCVGTIYGAKAPFIEFNDNHFAGRLGNVGYGSTRPIFNRNKFYGRWISMIILDANNLGFVSKNNDYGVAVPLVLQYLDAFIRNSATAGVWDFTSEGDLFSSNVSPLFNDEVHYAKHVGRSKGVYLNKQNDITQQEIHMGTGKIFRDNSTTKRSTSSVSLKPLVVGSDLTHDITIPVVSGESVEVAGYLRYDAAFYNSGTWTAPTAKLIDTDGATVLETFTPASSGTPTWYPFILNGTAGSTGNCTVRFTANPSSVITGTVYFDGVPNSPMIVKARHYGWTFDETNPKRTRNATVTTTGYTTGDLESDEATAIGITGIAVTGATSAIVVSASKTFQNLYDYTQAWACVNLTYNVPVTGSGANGSPVLSAVGDITVNDGYVLSGNGSLAIPSGKTLTTEFASGLNYTYTGGVWSQAATIPSFSGGTLNIGAAGTYTYTQAAAMILSMTPTAPGTYALGDTVFTGQVDLRNTAAHAITVELPTGTSYTTASNTGGTITVSLPVVTADISITSMPNDAAGTTRLQIINKTALSASAWAANTVYATGAIVKRTTGLGSESTAGLYFRATTGGTSHATTEPTWDTTVGNTTADNTVVWTCYAVLYYDADPAATSLADTYIDGEEFLDGEVAEIRFAEMNGSTSFKTYSTEVAITAAGFSALVAEEADSVFATFAIDGSTLEATFSPNYTDDYIVLDSNTDFAGKGAFAYYCYTLTTSAGMYNFWGGVTALDAGNIRINTSVLNLYFDESAGFVKQTDDVRIFRDDGLRPALDPTSGGEGIEINWRTPVSVVTTGGSALTPTESSYLLALPIATDNAIAVLTAAQTTPIHSDVRKVVGITVDGTGTDIDPWGPQ